MSNPYLARQQARRPMDHGKVSEKRVSKKLGARLHPNSGSMRGAKSDASLKKFRMEMKSTTATRLSLEMSWLSKITQEALHHGQIPCVTVSFVQQNGQAALSQHAEWVMLPMEVFREIVGDGS